MLKNEELEKSDAARLDALTLKLKFHALPPRRLRRRDGSDI